MQYPAYLCSSRSILVVYVWGLSFLCCRLSYNGMALLSRCLARATKEKTVCQ
jgi:hypothetical protein